MKITLVEKMPKSFRGSLIIPLFKPKDIEENTLFKNLPREDRVYLKKIVASVKWSEKEARLVPLPSNPAQGIIFLGLGERKKWQVRRLVLAVRRAVKFLKDNRIPRAAISLIDISIYRLSAAMGSKGKALSPDSETLSLIVRNLLMSEFEFIYYKEKPPEDWPKIEEIVLIAKTSQPLQSAFQEGIILGEEINSCRKLTNMPGGLISPRKLAEEARKLAKASGFKVEVLGQEKMKKLGMEAILGVARGSIEPPQFIILKYGPSKKTPLVFIGKGVTFDAGGLNLKPSDAMHEMHMDKAGAAAVLHAVSAIARLKLPVRVIGLIPAVENMPSGSSYRPGDILKSIIGKTIEVLGTDAEGRIIMADTLGYAQRYKPALIVDLATLTEAAVTALGQRVNALFANQEKLYQLGKEVGEKMGDYTWPMPLWEEYDEEIKGTFGDVANLGKTKYGDSIIGAVFLKQFVGDFPWIHVDIAPLMTTIEGQYLAKGASGTGVALLVGIAKKFH